LKKSAFGVILTRGMLTLVFGMTLLVCPVGNALAKPLIMEKGVIKSDTTWEKEVLVKGNLIRPGKKRYL
jgi:hypothetical protein